ncbi:ABC transporter [Saccharobesus litoralis]|uniref:ABC transporter n=1 Tax=Saccharobesus litoralis TaxID=2172099 RepID=A0A2S0VT64_9ALTE|nr:VacJ family lipoprotein [Saccharobesus litoralis]AWB67405.1 ABC transporter [Saccharobesus litoralis]
MQLKTSLVAFIAILASGCSSLPEQESNKQTSQVSNSQVESGDTVDKRDPLESINREVWDFNYQVLDKHVLRPVAVGYRDYMPLPARKGLVNATDNLDETAAILNNSLQGKFSDALTSLGRFTINSTLGVFGLFDIASKLGLEQKHESFEETLGVYGVDTGPYLMMPAYGPTDVRTTAGGVVDGMYLPLSDLNIWASVGRVSVKALEARIQLMDQEALLEDSFDSYTFVKEAYFQRLEYKVKDGKVAKPQESKQDLEDFEAFEEELEGLEGL